MNAGEVFSGGKRIWVLYLLFVLLLGGFSGFFIRVIAGQMVSDVKDQLKTDLRFLAANIEADLEKGNLDESIILINGWGRLHLKKIATIRLTDPDGRIVSEFISPVMPEEASVLRIPIEYRGKNGAFLELTANLDITKKDIRQYYLFFGSVIGLVIFFSGFILVLSGKRRRNLLDLEAVNIELRKFMTAFNQSPSCIIITDPDGKIEYVNPWFTELTGFKSDEVIGIKTSVLKSGKMSNAFYEEMWAVILGGKIWRGDILNRKKNGELYWEDAVIGPVFDNSGIITGFIAVKLDITEWKKVRIELEEHKHRLEELVKERTQSLEAKNKELKEINQLFTGRELKIRELSTKLREFEEIDGESGDE